MLQPNREVVYYYTRTWAIVKTQEKNVITYIVNVIYLQQMKLFSCFRIFETQVAQEGNDRSPETQHASNEGHVTPK